MVACVPSCCASVRPSMTGSHGATSASAMVLDGLRLDVVVVGSSHHRAAGRAGASLLALQLLYSMYDVWYEAEVRLRADRPIG